LASAFSLSEYPNHYRAEKQTIKPKNAFEIITFFSVPLLIVKLSLAVELQYFFYY
jgi:hypothetical protein